MGQIKSFNEWVSTRTDMDVLEFNTERKQVIRNIWKSLIQNNLDDYFEFPIEDTLADCAFYWNPRECQGNEGKQIYGIFYLKDPITFNMDGTTPVRLLSFGVSPNLICGGEPQNAIVAELRYVDEETDEDGDILSLEYNLEKDSWNWIVNAEDQEYNMGDDEDVDAMIKTITVTLNPETQYNR